MSWSPLRLCSIVIFGVTLACQEAPPAVSLDEVAERFVADLGAPDGADLARWLRDPPRAVLRRRCPDCPPERRLIEQPLTLEEGGEALGSALRGDASADERGDLFRLRHGDRRCEGSCCTWSVGLLEHGSTTLERACFEQDERGPLLRELTLIDG